MATTPTNLPVPSETPRDLKFNAGKIDEFVTSLVNTYLDRFGNEHYTIEGLRWLAQQAISEYGWVLIDSFQDGADITLPNQALRDEDSGEYYRWDGALPKHVDVGSTPSSSGGIGVGGWIGIGDASLRAMLATSSGASMVGAENQDGTTSNVQDVLNSHGQRISVREQQIDRTGHVTDLSREGTAAKFSQRYRVPHRLVNKTVPQDAAKKYDHFGIMDTKPDGTLYQIFRRGVNHLDEGITVYTELQRNGSWSSPLTVMSVPGSDCRGGAGGTAPDGTMYCAGSYMIPNSTPNVFTGAFVCKSVDYGATWQKISDIANPEAGTVSFVIPFGKMVVMGNKLVIPAYTRNGSYVTTLTYLQSLDNGSTWSIGSPIFTGADYNEAAILDMGDGVVLCVARTGDGTVQPDGSRRLHQFISPDGGVTWNDQGQVIGPDAADEIAWQLITPSLSLVYSQGGTPYVLLMYTARRGGIRYRTCPATTVTAGSQSWSVFYNAKIISSEFESGYQTQVVIDGNVLVNYYATTTTDAVCVATQFQMPLGELPDYESEWIAVTANTNVARNHLLAAIPRKTVILFSPDNIGKTGIFPVDNVLYYNGTTTVGAGIAWQVNLTGYTLRPGSYMYYQGVFGSGGLNPTSGFVKIIAWK